MYLAGTLGHVVDTRSTLATNRSRFASLGDAKVAHRPVMSQLLDHAVVIEYWGRGRVRTVAVDDASPPEVVLPGGFNETARVFGGRTQSDASRFE
jgi:hypothetical protein